MALVAFIALTLGIIMPGTTSVAQAGGGPTGVPWLRVYQVDPRSVYADAAGSAVVIAFDTKGLGTLESIEICHNRHVGCSSSRSGFYLGGYDWGNSIQTGWTWMASTPAGGVLRTRAILTTPDGRREVISTEETELQPTREASNETWVFIDQAPSKIGETLKLRIERDLGLPIIRSEVCITGMTTSIVWACRYEDERDWGLLLNGAGTQFLDLTLSHPNLVREGPRGKLLSFPNGAQITARYTMVDGSSVSFQSQSLSFP
ncbi:MAG: hypothetical protein HYS83_01130 [Candidatus Blackburnbacteria bacterium]|nr:hypothetical protein [Candidatus Blackburnbacteria bacterium]